MTQPIAPAGKLKGTALIWIGVLAMIAGVVGGIVMVVSGAVDLAHVAEGYQRVPASGGTIALDEEGRYNVFYETYDPSSSSILKSCICRKSAIVSKSTVSST